ncbi:hypothetical protein B0A48_05646 [Cryoendolithus antarcticus]|uniref:Ribosomal protein S17 n=1 Tax=Cryoendolithus antarcticus TaxID=1507870 RepID=A0A1V8TJ38_9PEZI|nr:hypothetical protein B0A48_05646 [Cryoendolithus antarcticus]
MSTPTFPIPLRLLSRHRVQDKAQHICRRCLSLQSTQPSTPPTPPPNYNPSLAFSARQYPLSPIDRALKRPLPGTHHIRPQLLMHVDPAKLHSSDRARQEKNASHKKILGVVVRTGRMDKTVTVRIPGQRWDGRIKKHFSAPTQHLVHDPASSLLPGDVISLHRLRVSSTVHHVVAEIITPFGKPISERPPIPTPEERFAAYKTARLAKLERRKLRREAGEGKEEAVAELKALGLGTAEGVDASKGAKGRTQAGSVKSAVTGSVAQAEASAAVASEKAAASKVNERARLNKERAEKKKARVEKQHAKVEETGEEETGEKAETVGVNNT